MSIDLMEALTALNTTLQQLLPVAADASLAPELVLNPLNARPSGVGGVIGTRSTPPIGEIGALKVTAEAMVRVKASSLAGLPAAESEVSSALLGANPSSLRSSGVQRIRRLLDAVRSTTSGPGVAGSELRFEVLYEFSKRPGVGEGLIASVPVDLLQRNATGSSPSELLRLELEQDPFAQLEVVDDQGLTEPGNWRFDAAAHELSQSRAAHGGSEAFDALKRSSYCLVKPQGLPPAPSNFLLYASARSDQPGGLGLVFRFQDVDNFYYALLHEAPGMRYRVFGKKQAGVFSFLPSNGVDSRRGYALSTWFSLRLAVQGDELALAIDGVEVLRGRDTDNVAPGRVGLLSRSAGTRFRFLRWLAL